MFIPTSGQLDAAVVAFSDKNTPDDDKLEDAIKESNGVMSTWLSILIAHLSASANALVEDDTDEEAKQVAYRAALKEVMAPKNSKPRQAAKSALQAGIQIGIRVSEPAELTKESLSAGAIAFGLDTAATREGRVKFGKLISDLLGPTFLSLVELACGLGSSTEITKQETDQLLAKDSELAKRLGAALTIGLSVGARLRNPPRDQSELLKQLMEQLGAPKMSGKSEPGDEEIRGGWK